MDAIKFLLKYPAFKTNSRHLLSDWESEIRLKRTAKDIDSLLNTVIEPSVILGDLLIGDGLLDQISDPLRDGMIIKFAEKHGDDGGLTYNKIREILIEKALHWENGSSGFVSLIKGYAAEQHFVDNWGSAAELAQSATQKGWDVVINKDGVNEYVQVKLRNNASEIINEITDLQEKINSGCIDGIKDETVSNINWAIPDELVDEVNNKLHSLGIKGAEDIKIYSLGKITSEGIGDEISKSIDKITDGNIAKEFGGSVATSLAVISIFQAVMVLKGAKSKQKAIEDLKKSMFISTFSKLPSFAFKNALDSYASKLALGSGVVGGASVGVAIVASQIGKRVYDRFDLTEQIKASTELTQVLTSEINNLTVL